MKFPLTLLLCWLALDALAQTPITVPIETQDFALVLQTDATQRLGTVYFGARLRNSADYANIRGQYRIDENNSAICNSAYTPAGTWNLVEPAIQVVQADGNNSLELLYRSHRTERVSDGVQQTNVVLTDPVYPVEVTLCFKVYTRDNVIEQWSVIKNNGKAPIQLLKYASANLYFNAEQFHLRHYQGVWAKEMRPNETRLSPGILSLDSKLGSRTNLFQPPTFALSIGEPATETTGKVLLANLGWSGNFKIDFEVDTYHNLRLIAGINPFASAYTLAVGQSFATPALVYTYSEQGAGPASRQLHRWARDFRIPDGNGSRLTLLNNWEATYFDFDENKLVGLFGGAKKLGVDLFLLDDGWFANKYPRNGDTAGLGDWQENRQKLPHGLGYLVQEATKAGVKFGIWVEPEMVNPKSELYEQHRDWVIRQPERPEHYFRNQLVLDLTNPEVQDFVYGVLDGMFTRNPGIAFVKWDCNAVIYNAHSQYLERQKLPQSHLYVEYVRGLYKVLERLRAKYPKVPMMLCSGGGGRVDYEALRYFTEFWLSDNTDPLERVFQQWEYSYYYPAIAHCDHITDWSKVGLKYRTDVAMMGKMGYDIVVDHLSADDLAFSQQSVATYKSLSDLVWHGDLYRLVNPWDHPLASLIFVNAARERAVVYNYAVSNRYDQTYTSAPIQLAGLDQQKRYKVREVNLYPGTTSTVNADAVYSGDFLMKVGINPDVTQRRTSVVLEVTAVKN